MKEGDEQPVELNLEFIYEYVKTQSGQTITPVGLQIEVNDRPLGIAVSPDGTQAAVTTASRTHGARAASMVGVMG